MQVKTKILMHKVRANKDTKCKLIFRQIHKKK